METIVEFKNQLELKEFIKAQASKVINEGKMQSMGFPNDLEMNKKDGSKNSVGAKVEVKETGVFKTKTSAPVNIPKQSKIFKDAVDVKMSERDGGSDEKNAAATKIEGTKSEKAGVETNPFIKGQVKSKVETKSTQPNVSIEADPTKEGGIPGKKDNNVEMNTEDKDDKTENPKTQILGKGEISKDGFSKGQVDKEINKKAVNDKDEYEQKLRDSIKTIQLPESFKNKKAMLEFIKKEAIRISSLL